MAKFEIPDEGLDYEFLWELNDDQLLTLAAEAFVVMQFRADDGRSAADLCLQFGEVGKIMELENDADNN